MSSRAKTILAALLGVVAGMALLGGAFALPTAVRAGARSAYASQTTTGTTGYGYGYGMMGRTQALPQSQESTRGNAPAVTPGTGRRVNCPGYSRSAGTRRAVTPNYTGSSTAPRVNCPNYSGGTAGAPSGWGPANCPVRTRS